MERREKKILSRVNHIMKKYNDDDSIYYHELKTTLYEYKSISTTDKTTTDLYLKHMDTLCNMIVEKRNANFIIAGMILFFLGMVILTTYSSIRYFDLSNNLKNNIIKTAKTASLLVDYENLNSFNAVALGNNADYMDINPLTINLSASGDEGAEIVYNVYILEKNDKSNPENIIDRSAFLYYVNHDSSSGVIKYLGNSEVSNGKIKIYTGSIKVGETQKVNIRLWIDAYTSVDHENKNYNFKLYVDGNTVQTNVR